MAEQQIFQKDDLYRIKVNASGYCPARFNRIPLSEASSNHFILNPFILNPLDMSVSGVVVDADGKPVRLGDSPFPSTRRRSDAVPADPQAARR